MYVSSTVRGFKVGDRAILDTTDVDRRKAWMDSGFGHRLGTEVEILEVEPYGNVIVKFISDNQKLATTTFMLNELPVKFTLEDVYDPIQQLAAAKKKTDDNLRELFGYKLSPE